jgi:hypothetical protein
VSTRKPICAGFLCMLELLYRSVMMKTFLSCSFCGCVYLTCWLGRTMPSRLARCAVCRVQVWVSAIMSRVGLAVCHHVTCWTGSLSRQTIPSRHVLALQFWRPITAASVPTITIAPLATMDEAVVEHISTHTCWPNYAISNSSVCYCRDCVTCQHASPSVPASSVC